MEKDLAITISKLINKWSNKNNSFYSIREIPTTLNTLVDFQQWANGKPIVAAYHLSKVEEEDYYFLFIDWHRNQNYYLVIYIGNKTTTAAEIREVKELNGKLNLTWKYNPLKRDGRNAERKTYFKQSFGSLIVEIPLPTKTEEIEEFFNQLYKLCRNRQTADRIIDKFDL